jgi:predicted nuclease of predicted toxin-antitoxin system
VKVLLDHCAPKRLRRLFPAHEVRTAYEMGWSGLKNGKLMAEAAAAGFEVLLTVDQSIPYQQNPTALPLAVVILVAVNNRFDTLAPHAPEIEAALSSVTPGQIIRVPKGA